MTAYNTFAWLGMLVGARYLGEQIIHYLSSGTWNSFSLLHLFYRWEWFGDWVANPDKWFGLHNVLGFLNAGAVLILAFGAMARDIFKDIVKDQRARDEREAELKQTQ